jgi:hypothetical protein
MADDQQYKVFYPDKIWMSAEARGWAKEHKMSEQEFAKYLIARHRESGDPFAGDMGSPAGRDQIEGFAASEPQADMVVNDVVDDVPGQGYSNSPFPFE